MGLSTYDAVINRVAGNFHCQYPIWGEQNVATSATVLTGAFMVLQRIGWGKTLPSLPTGVTAYIPTSVHSEMSTAGWIVVAKLISLGSLDISGPTFTDGSAMPTVTELGASHVTASAVLVEVTTTLNATPGNMTITYVDQDGNASETSPSTALTASSAAGSVSFVPLNTGDWGVQDITTATRTAGTTPTGVVQFWGVVPIALFHNDATGGHVENMFTAGGNILRLGAGDKIGVFASTSNARAILGAINFIGDN